MQDYPECKKKSGKYEPISFDDTICIDLKMKKKKMHTLITTITDSNKLSFQGSHKFGNDVHDSLRAQDMRQQNRRAN